MSFADLGLHPTLLRNCKQAGYADPTPVQAEAIPVALTGNDLIATAQTGTGKTAAFLLPTLHRLFTKPAGTVHALVLTPTRELAVQIDSVFRTLAAGTGVRGAVVVGGVGMTPQERAIRAGTELLIATPGRLLDHLRTHRPRFAGLSVLILDEADRMLDMGFLPDIRRVIAQLPKNRQTLLFSATMPPVIEKLALEIQRTPKKIQIGRRETVAVGITQAAYPVPEHLKSALLRHLLRKVEMPSVLVFTRTKHGAKKLARTVAADGYAVGELHSNLSQAQRNRAMEAFRAGETQVMVATNIAARGLDVEHITHVISYDVPHVPEDYIHRIGRTGRAEAEGDAFVLVAPEEEAYFARIERHIGQRLPRVLEPGFDYKQAAPPKPAAPSANGKRGGGRKPKAKPSGGGAGGGSGRAGKGSPKGKGGRR